MAITPNRSAGLEHRGVDVTYAGGGFMTLFTVPAGREVVSLQLWTSKDVMVTIDGTSSIFIQQAIRLPAGQKYDDDVTIRGALFMIPLNTGETPRVQGSAWLRRK